MGTMRVMHPAKGDAVLTWNPASKGSTAGVKRAFDELIRNGMTGYTSIDGQDTVIRDFSPQFEEITMIAPLQGG